MPNQFLSPEGDIENYFVTEYWLIDQYIGDELWTWGSGSGGILGNASTVDVSTPITTFAGGTNWKQVSGGASHTVVIKTDGTLWTWGNNISGSLGNGIIAGIISTPITTFAGGTNWKQVSTGYRYTAAIKTDGTLWTWGSGQFGKLGNAVTTNVSTPVTTFAGGTNWKQVDCGRHLTAAIKTDGTLWTWGFGGNGQLGNATLSIASTPVTTFAGGTNWKQVGAGYIAAAIKTDGTLWVWGEGGNGALGNGRTTLNNSIPITTFAGGTNWKEVTCGTFANALAIKTDGTLWTWGFGSSGQLGNASTISVSTPVTTFAGGTNWKQVSCGNFASFTTAIKTDGTLWTWGSGSGGKLGNASTVDVSTPITTFAGGTDWKQVSPAPATAAIKSGISPDLPLS